MTLLLSMMPAAWLCRRYQRVKSRQIIDDALQILLNLDHRGACGSEENTGDGAGI
ncbi:MAG: hypothetical protein R2932_13520 [Caldilineaceae bacterium]